MPGPLSAPGIRNASDYAVRRTLRTTSPKARPKSPAMPIKGIGLAVLGIDGVVASVVLVEGVELVALDGVVV